MALHSELPVYKANYDLLQAIVKVVKNMPRDFKQILGCELRDHSMTIAKLVLRANMAQEKLPFLNEIIERKEAIELLTRLCRDLKLISQGQYATVIQLSAQLGKQTNGWRSQQLRQTLEGQGHHDRPLF